MAEDRNVRLTRAEAATKELLEATRKAHEAIAEMRETMAEAERKKEEYVNRTLAAIQGTFEGAVRGHMKSLKKHIERTQGMATKKIFAEFDKIMNILMGKEDPDEPDMVQTARQFRSTLEAIQDVRAQEIPDMYRRTGATRRRSK